MTVFTTGVDAVDVLVVVFTTGAGSNSGVASWTFVFMLAAATFTVDADAGVISVSWAVVSATFTMAVELIVVLVTASCCRLAVDGVAVVPDLFAFSLSDKLPTTPIKTKNAKIPTTHLVNFDVFFGLMVGEGCWSMVLIKKVSYRQYRPQTLLIQAPT